MNSIISSPDFKTTRRSAHRYHLDNGITLLVARNASVNISAARLFFRGGARLDPPQQAGRANLMATVLTKGTRRRDSQEIGVAVESLGSAIGVDCTADYLEVGLKCVSSDLPEVLTLVAEILREPSFPGAEVKREQELMLQTIRAQHERPFSLAFDQLRRALYGNHPYAFPIIGREHTIGSLTQADVIAFHALCCRPDRLVIAAVTPQPTEQIRDQIEAVLGDWSAPRPGSPLPEPVLPPLPPSRWLTLQQPTQQSLIMIGARGAAARSQDYPLLKLMATYLGSGLSSRLFIELREKRGLAYEVSAFFGTRQDPAPFVAYMGTAAENTQIAIESLQRELGRLRESPLSVEEVEVAKRKLLGQYALGKQTNAQIAQLLGWYEVLGLGMEFDQHYPEQIQSITPEDLHRVALTYLAEPVISVVGPVGSPESPDLSEQCSN